MQRAGHLVCCCGDYGWHCGDGGWCCGDGGCCRGDGGCYSDIMSLERWHSVVSFCRLRVILSLAMHAATLNVSAVMYLYITRFS